LNIVSNLLLELRKMIISKYANFIRKLVIKKTKRIAMSLLDIKLILKPMIWSFSILILTIASYSLNSQKTLIDYTKVEEITNPILQPNQSIDFQNIDNLLESYTSIASTKQTSNPHNSIYSEDEITFEIEDSSKKRNKSINGPESNSSISESIKNLYSSEGKIANFNCTISCNAIENSSVNCNGGSDGSATVSISGEMPPISTPDSFDEIWIETECQTIGSNWDIINDPSRSNGQYLTWTGDNSYNSPSNNPDDLLIYNFEVNDAGTYQLWGLCLAPNTDDDSFWVKIDNNDWVRWNQITGSNTWQWDDLHDDRFNSGAAISYFLSSGIHTLTISYRENGASIDKLHLTNNGSTPFGFGGSDSACINLTYDYRWDNGENTATAVSLTAGLHTVTVSDNNNCSTTCIVNINEPSIPLFCKIALNNSVTCESALDGEGTILPTGGTEPYSFLWDNGVTTANTSNLFLGIHNATVTDANGCTTTCSIDITALQGEDTDNDSVNDIRDLDDDNDGIPDCIENNVSCNNRILGPNLIINGSFSDGYLGWTSDFNRGRNNNTNVPATNGGCDTQGWIAISPCETFNGICDEYYNYLGSLYDGSLLINDPVGTGDNIFNTICDRSNDNCEPRPWPDNTGNGDNLSLYIDPSDIAGRAYWRQEIYVQSCVTYEFSAFLQTVEEDPNLVFRVGGIDIAGPFNFDGLIAPNGGPDIWQQVATTWESTLNGVVSIELVNTTAGCSGNDIKLDDVFFGEIWCDTDSDGIANHLDLDSDNDGIPDAVEACGNIGLILEDCSLDINNSDSYEIDPDTGCSNGIIIGSGCVTINDTDNDNIPDFIDLDSDNDGCSDATEACTDSNINVNNSSTSEDYNNPASSVNDYGLVSDGASYLCPDIDNTNWINNSIGCIECIVNLEQDEQCFGDENGSATVSPSGGLPPYTYLWDNGETSITAINLSGGVTHFVSVTDACGHLSICDIFINQPNELTCSVIQENGVTCVGGNDGVGFVTPNGGFGVISYLWDNGETTSRAIELTSGNHIVTVTDENGCTSSCSVNIDEPTEAVSCNAVENSSVVCNGESNGVATVNPTGGSGGYSFQWDNGQNGQTANSLNAGLHTVTVTDSNGCTSTCSVTINEPTDPISCSAIEDSPVVCKGERNGVATVTPSGGNGNYRFQWDNGENTQTASFLNAGLHVVTVTDFRNCFSTCSVVISEPLESLSCSVVQDSPVVCRGENNAVATVTPNGGTSGYTFQWDNGESTATATALNGGFHVVTVTDSRECVTTCSIFINEPNAPIACVITQVSSVACFGESTGSSTVLPINGNGNYSFEWDNGEITDMAIALDAGLHIVTVSDFRGCSTTCSVTINEPMPLVIDAGSNVTICDGESVTINSMINGGSPGYNFEWSTGATSQNINVTPIGNPNLNTTVSYTVTVTDRFNCTSTDVIDINVESNPSAIVSPSNPTCGDNNGSITFTFSDHPDMTGLEFSLNNQGSYESPINDNSATITYDNLPPGTYNLWVRWDNGNCPINLGSVSLQDLNGFPICTIVEDSPVICNGEANGIATASTIGGNCITPNIALSGTASSISVRSNGVPTRINDNDTNGRWSGGSIAHTAGSTSNDWIDLDLESLNEINNIVLWNRIDQCCSARLSNSYLLVSTTPFPNNSNLTQSLANAEFTYQIGNSTGTDSFDIPVQISGRYIRVQKSGNNTNGNTLQLAEIQVFPTCYTYVWDNGETTSTAIALDAGLHTVTVTDSAGCVSECSINIGEPSDPLTCTVEETKPVDCDLENNGQALATPEGGNGGYTYLWDNGENTATAISLGLGIHSVTITDSKGCTTSCSVESTENEDCCKTIFTNKHIKYNAPEHR